MSNNTAPVTLAPMPWDRRAVVRDTLTETEIGGDGEAVERRIDVWRREVPALVRDRDPGQRLAFEKFAATLEALGASVGTVDPSSAAGAATVRPAPDSPSSPPPTAWAVWTPVRSTIPRPIVSGGVSGLPAILIVRRRGAGPCGTRSEAP